MFSSLMLRHHEQREFTNDCIFNERLEDNYNYYTSTYHSSTLRTYYVALNRVGVPRKTHLPANKPLGKLSTYVKSFTLIVPELRSEAVIGQRFGINHVKHGIKHLCESGKELMELSAKQLIYPECNSSNNSGSSSSSSSSTSNHNSNNGSSLSVASSNLTKKQPNHNIRHHRKLVPAALTDRSQHRKTTFGAHHNTRTKATDCTASQCPKRKKSSAGVGGNGTMRKTGNANKKNVKKSSQKSNKSKSNRRIPPKTTSTTTTSTPNTILYESISHADNYDDELEDSSIALPNPTNGHTSLASDEDYEEDK